MKILVCVNHPYKPASKKCKVCGDGLCKHCPTRATTNYNGDWEGHICEKCDKTEAKRGIVKFALDK